MTFSTAGEIGKYVKDYMIYRFPEDFSQEAGEGN
jgi:hypothetical protein